MTSNERYAILYTRMKRLMTQNARKNQEECNLLRQELKVLRDHGEVSKSVIDTVPYIGSLGPIPPYPTNC